MNKRVIRDLVVRDNWKIHNNLDKQQLIFQIFDDEYTLDTLYIAYNLLEIIVNTKCEKKITVLETENWLVQNDYKNHQLIISYFEDAHFVNDILIEHDYLLKLIGDE